MILRRIPYSTSAQQLLSHLPSSSSSSSPTTSPSSSSLSTIDPWIAKIVSTLFLLTPPPSVSSRLAPLRHLLNPSIVSAAIRRIHNPHFSLALFSVTKTHFHINHSVETYQFLVRILCQHGLHTHALKLFDEMQPPKGPVLGILVISYARTGQLDGAMGLLRGGEECGHGCRVDAYYYNFVVSRLIKAGRCWDGVEFLCRRLKRSAFAPDTWSFNIAIKGLCRLGEIDQAFEMFGYMEKFQCSPDSVTYNTLIDGFCRANRVDTGQELLVNSRMRGLWSPDVVTYTSIISGYCRVGKMNDAAKIYDEMVSSGLKPNKITYNVLIDGYGKAGNIAAALSMYKKMILAGCCPDIVTMTSLIDGHCRNGLVDDAMDIWYEMKEKNILPNAYTFSIVINALCKQNRLCEARVLLTELRGREDIIVLPFIYNPLIDGFCKAGNVDEANQILAEMKEVGCFPDKVTYTILIIGHCMKGRMSEALNLFQKMKMSGILPDNITINSFVSCLLKAGMPKEANGIVDAVSGKVPGWYFRSTPRENSDVSVTA